MKRREFIKLVGGAGAMWPLVAPAQQPQRMRRIGVFVNLASNKAYRTTTELVQVAFMYMVLM